jgi:hypothetical protein
MSWLGTKETPGDVEMKHYLTVSLDGDTTRTSVREAVEWDL